MIVIFISLRWQRCFIGHFKHHLIIKILFQVQCQRGGFMMQVYKYVKECKGWHSTYNRLWDILQGIALLPLLYTPQYNAAHTLYNRTYKLSSKQP